MTFLFCIEDVLGFTKRDGDMSGATATATSWNKAASATECGKACLLVAACVAFLYAEAAHNNAYNEHCYLRSGTFTVYSKADHWVYTKRKPSHMLWQSIYKQWASPYSRVV